MQKSFSPWASPVILVKKKDASLSICIHSRALNKIAKKDTYPVLRIDGTPDYVSDVQHISSLDAFSGLWLVELAEEDSKMTAFIGAGNGLYEYNVMPFGLDDALATFHRLMEIVMQGLQWHWALVYIEFGYNPDFDNHLRELRNAFEGFCKAKLKLKGKKCVFDPNEVPQLGRIISNDGIKSDQAKSG